MLLRTISVAGSLVAIAAFATGRAAALAHHHTAVATQPPTSIAITGVVVIDVAQGRRVSGQTVLITGARIAAVGARIAVPKGTRVIDGRGRFLIPGLWDMHVHSAVAVDREFPLYLAQGVTGVRNMHSTADTALALTNSIKRRLNTGTLVGPRFLANGPLLDGVGSVHRGAFIVRNADEARRAVDSLARGGADFVKLYDYLPRDAFFAAVAESRRVGLPVTGHVPYSVSVVEAAESGITSIEHMRGLEYDCSPVGDSLRAEVSTSLVALAAGTAKPAEVFPVRERVLERAIATRDEARCAAAIDVLRRRGTWVVATLGWGSTDGAVIVNDSARMQFVPARTRATWARMVEEDRTAPQGAWAKRNTADRANIPMLRRAGVPILSGTDVGDFALVAGFALHDNLAQLVATGLTPAEALRTATLNPARYLRATDSLGTVARGKLADLVLLDGDPLRNITNTRRIRAVVLNGRYFDRAALDTLLASSARAANTPAVTNLR